MTSVYVKTLGCKVNTFDSQVLENQFKQQGYAIVASPVDADVTVVNTCSVTANAEKEALYWLRRYRRENPEAMRVVTGCYAQINSARLAGNDDVDFVVPNEVKERLVDFVKERIDNPVAAGQNKMAPGAAPVLDNKQGHFKSSLTLFDNPLSTRTRAFVKVQDGCNGFCSYCQIPYARGASRSVPAAQVLAEIRALAEKGVPEIVFTGIHIGDYGEDLSPATSLVELLEQVLGFPGIGRIRISSLEPAEVSLGLIELLARHEHLVCDHFHLPLQSGCDRVLKAMNRKYTTAEYFATLQLIRRHFPDAQLSADVIVGFPGETAEEFEQTIAFIESCELGSLHVFPYSKRPNTAAARMPGHLPPEEIRSRVARLKALSESLHHTFASRFVGRTLNVLWENRSTKDRGILGKTKNYIQVLASNGLESAVTPGTVIPTRLMGFARPGCLLGTSPKT